MIAGCGADLFVNICLTILGFVLSSLRSLLVDICKHRVAMVQVTNYRLPSLSRYFPGHIHAFYLEYIYFERRSQSQMGNMAVKRAPGIYSDNVNSGGRTTYGTVAT